VKRLGKWLLALAALLLRAVPRRRKRESDRIVPPETPDRGAETAVIVLLLLSALAASGFTVLYAFDSLGNRTQLFGITLSLALGFLAAALIVAGKRLIPTEELEEDYPPEEHLDEQREILQLVDESGSAITRKRLLLASGGAAVTALGAAALTPALSFGPALDPANLYETPWRRGRRLVDSNGRPLRADDISTDTFYSAYPEGAKKDKIGSPIVLVRFEPSELRLPPGRDGWAPEGILAYSKICTHAGCAVSLYRRPLFGPVEPSRALVCPCHYSTFDPAAGAAVIFGPAGRPLPQLPLMIDENRELRAAGNFSDPVGPAWGGVRGKEPT
jgi:ubiquinol-cytochrome c reductase iron-sulfur subunit